MAKHRKTTRLKKEERDELLLEFCHALCSVKTSEEAATFLRDLLSHQEIEMLAKRLKIARLLLQEKRYDEIHEILDVSSGTIARINAWLSEGGEGYRFVIQRTKDQPLRKARQRVVKDSGGNWKRKYPMYFWPELLLQDIVRGASRRQQEQLVYTLRILEKSKKKTKLFQTLERLLREQQRQRR